MNYLPSTVNSDNSRHDGNNETSAPGNGRDLNLHFLDKVRLSATTRGDAMKEDEGEELPMKLNKINSAGGFLIVSPDNLSVKYTNMNLHGHDVGVVQANKPAPFKCLIYYFKIFVKDVGSKGQVAIGFTKESFKMWRQTGLVKTYLLHYGYEETLNAFNPATKNTVPPIHIAQEDAIDEYDHHML